MKRNDREQFVSWIETYRADLSESQIERLLRFAALVIEGSERMGLVARGDLPRLHMRHLREALAPQLTEAIPEAARVLDVGSGGGFPGVPLGITRPDIDLELLEPRHRRAAFLERSVLVLGLNEVKVHTASIDAFSSRPRGELFGWAVSRGVAWTAPMVRCLERVTTVDAHLVRFGAPEVAVASVEAHSIDADVPRAIQVWPRRTWDRLPGAR